MRRRVFLLASGGVVLSSASGAFWGAAAANSVARYPNHSVGRPTLLGQLGGLPIAAANVLYAPGGSQIAWLGAKLVVADLETGARKEFSELADDAAHGSRFQEFLWADDHHLIVTERQSRSSLSLSDPEQDLVRFVLIAVDTGARVRTVIACPSVAGVAGSIDADVWYVRTADNRLRTFDCRTGALGADDYFTYTDSGGSAMQTAPGSEWFTVKVPNLDWRRPEGELVVFNVRTGERRSMNDVFLPGGLRNVTADGRYAIAARVREGKTVWYAADFAAGVEMPLDLCDVAAVGPVSSARGAALLYVSSPGVDANHPQWRFEESALVDLVGL